MNERIKLKLLILFCKFIDKKRVEENKGARKKKRVRDGERARRLTGNI